MIMTWEELTQAIADAERIERQAKEAVQKTARMCVGRLRAAKVDAWILSALKRELRDWNMHQGCWRNHG